MDEVVLHWSSVHGIHGDVPSSVRRSWSAKISEAHPLSEAISNVLHCFTCTKQECLMWNAHAGMHSHRCNGHTPANADWMFTTMGLRLGRYLWAHENKRPAVCGGHEIISKDFDLTTLFNKVGFHVRGCLTRHGRA